MIYSDWIGREERTEDVVTARPVQAMAATLDRTLAAREGDVLPRLWHWMYFTPLYRMRELGVEGHAETGEFLPPVDLPRRMWAGGRLEFASGDAALRVGDRAVRVSRVMDVKEKQGRSGRLVFIVVRHEVSTERGFALSEEHDIVYREHASSNDIAGPEAPKDPTWTREVMPSDVLLFRYSALTFNSHRIHYDRRYTVEEEHYPGLVVHGPLIATLLMDLLREKMLEFDVRRFEFRAVSPLFHVEPNPEAFVVCGTPRAGSVELWAQSLGGRLAMTAVAT